MKRLEYSQETYEKLDKELGKELPRLETTEMFYFTAGQVARHILKRSPAGRYHNKINPLLAAKTSGELKKKILTAFKSNNIDQNERFEHALAIVLGWKQDDPMDEETLILGYMTKSAF